MARSANIQSIATLKAFRSSLVKFAEAVELSLAESNAELEWTVNYIKNDRYRYWKAQVFSCTENATQARLALKRRRIFERALQGSPGSCIDEIKALKRAERRLEIAQRTYQRLQYWLGELDLEKTRFKGASQKMREVSEGRIPRAIAQLDRWVDALESYVRLAPPETLTPRETTDSSEPSSLTRPIENALESSEISTDDHQDHDVPSQPSEDEE